MASASLVRLTHCGLVKVMWQHRSGSTLAQVMTCCLMAQNHYLNQFWFIIIGLTAFYWEQLQSEWSLAMLLMNLKIILLKLLPHLPGANEIIHVHVLYQIKTLNHIFNINYTIISIQTEHQTFQQSVWTVFTTVLIIHPFLLDDWKCKHKIHSDCLRA